ncbi:MAG TPA: 50S ribosomal protein L9 [Alphaproteobacteria bacterium]|nr:50S ribosomal protein L9 [Alphaproteobacteria bacterium]
MEVILLERVERLGQMGDVVKVKNGFARNYLLPQKKALRATDANRTIFEEQKAIHEARNLERAKEAEAVAEKLNGQSCVLLRQAAESGQLYGSVTARDVADAVGELGFKVQRGQVQLATPIKELGLHTVSVSLHPDVSAEVQINIARSEEEARRQSEPDKDEALAEAEAMFETEELAEQAAKTLTEEESESASAAEEEVTEEASDKTE